MSSDPRPSFYTLTTTDGRQVTIYAAPGADPWQAATQSPRGAKVNVGPLGRGSSDHPTWAGRSQQETLLSPSGDRDHDLGCIVDLSPQQARDLLTCLQSCDQWTQEGIVAGTPMTRFIVNQPHRPPEAVGVGQIRFDSKCTSSPPGYSALAPRSAQVFTRLAQASSSVKPRRLYRA